jgi:hypothetical protein
VSFITYQSNGIVRVWIPTATRTGDCIFASAGASTRCPLTSALMGQGLTGGADRRSRDGRATVVRGIRDARFG